MENIGKGWILLEESFHTKEKYFLTILNPRKTPRDVAYYIEQSYVDRFGSFEEKVSFKKHPKKSPFSLDRYSIGGPIISHGHDPMYCAYYAQKIEKNGNELIFHYKTYHGDLDNRKITESIQKSIITKP